MKFAFTYLVREYKRDEALKIFALMNEDSGTVHFNA
jgi:hypothetical protein